MKTWSCLTVPPENLDQEFLPHSSEWHSSPWKANAAQHVDCIALCARTHLVNTPPCPFKSHLMANVQSPVSPICGLGCSRTHHHIPGYTHLYSLGKQRSRACGKLILESKEGGWTGCGQRLANFKTKLLIQMCKGRTIWRGDFQVFKMPASDIRYLTHLLLALHCQWLLTWHISGGPRTPVSWAFFYLGWGLVGKCHLFRK